MKPRVAKKGEKRNGFTHRNFPGRGERFNSSSLSLCDRMTHCKRRERKTFFCNLWSAFARNLGEVVPPQKCEIKCFNLKTNFDSQMYNTFSRIPLANLGSSSEFVLGSIYLLPPPSHFLLPISFFAPHSRLPYRPDSSACLGVVRTAKV